MGTPSAANGNGNGSQAGHVDIMSNTPPGRKKKGGTKQDRRADGEDPDAANGGEVWELDCEVCKRKGWNIVRFQP